MRRSPAYLNVALMLGSAILISCAPAATTQHAESDRNIVTAADIDQYPDMPLELIIQRKVPGVTAHNVNGVMILQIRGATSVSKNDMQPASINPATPLYVVNGMRTPPTSNGEMPSIPAREIQTIKVLKGSDAGIYGLDGSNGVIEITTKGH
jgi:TonB-dependent SusC/RagA subfamily outer membrane receptor